MSLCWAPVNRVNTFIVRPPGWLSGLSICLWQRSPSQGAGIESCIGLPAQQGVCFSLSPTPPQHVLIHVSILSLSLSQINKISFKKNTFLVISGSDCAHPGCWPSFILSQGLSSWSVKWSYLVYVGLNLRDKIYISRNTKAQSMCPVWKSSGDHLLHPVSRPRTLLEPDRPRRKNITFLHKANKGNGS